MLLRRTKNCSAFNFTYISSIEPCSNRTNKTYVFNFTDIKELEMYFKVRGRNM